MRKSKALTAALGAASLSLFTADAFASGGHYPVDDTEIAEPGTVQIEQWYGRVDGDSWDLAILPALTLPNIPLELTAGYARVKSEGDRFHRLEPSAKYQLRSVEAGGIGAALSLTGGHEDGRWNDWLVNVPLSVAVPNTPMIVHLNAGWLRERDDGWNDRLFIGSGFEWALAEQVLFLGQVYREGSAAKPEAQLGLRVATHSALEHVDLAVGRVLGDDNDWFMTLGITLTL